jgi:hypothetical protein
MKLGEFIESLISQLSEDEEALAGGDLKEAQQVIAELQSLQEFQAATQAQETLTACVAESLVAANDNPPYWRSGQTVYRRVAGYFPDWRAAEQEIERLNQENPDSPYIYSSHPYGPADIAKQANFEFGAACRLQEQAGVRDLLAHEQRRREGNKRIDLKFSAGTTEVQAQALAFLLNKLDLETLAVENVYDGPSKYDGRYWVYCRLLLPLPAEPEEPELKLKKPTRRQPAGSAPRRRRR